MNAIDLTLATAAGAWVAKRMAAKVVKWRRLASLVAWQANLCAVAAGEFEVHDAGRGSAGHPRCLLVKKEHRFLVDIRPEVGVMAIKSAARQYLIDRNLNRLDQTQIDQFLNCAREHRATPVIWFPLEKKRKFLQLKDRAAPQLRAVQGDASDVLTILGSMW